MECPTQASWLGIAWLLGCKRQVTAFADGDFQTHCNTAGFSSENEGTDMRHATHRRASVATSPVACDMRARDLSGMFACRRLT